MPIKTPVRVDDVARINELAALGYGRKKIADWVGVTESAVAAVLNGTRESISDELSTRQISAMLNRSFRPRRIPNG